MHGLLAAAALILTGCGAPTPPAGHAAQLREEAVLHDGDVRIRATVVPTAGLNEAMARQYGIVRSPRSVLLLVGVRSGPEWQETALPARVSASVSDLRGVRRRVDMREVRSGDPGSEDQGDLIDYIGTARVAPPDTLRFDLEIVREDGARSVMQFSRDIYPQ